MHEIHNRLWGIHFICKTCIEHKADKYIHRSLYTFLCALICIDIRVIYKDHRGHVHTENISAHLHFIFMVTRWRCCRHTGYQPVGQMLVRLEEFQLCAKLLLYSTDTPKWITALPSWNGLEIFLNGNQDDASVCCVESTLLIIKNRMIDWLAVR